MDSRSLTPSSAKGAGLAALDRRWLDSCWNGWGRPLEEYGWGPEGIPAVMPVRYIPGKGLVVDVAKGEASTVYGM